MLPREIVLCGCRPVVCGCPVVWLCGSGLQQLLPEEVLPSSPLLWRSARWFARLPVRLWLQVEVLQQRLQQLQQLCGAELCCCGRARLCGPGWMRCRG